MQEKLKRQSAQSVEDIVQQKFTARLSRFSGGATIVTQEQAKQLKPGATKRRLYRDDEDEFVAFMEANPGATKAEIAEAFDISEPGALLWRSRSQKSIGVTEDVEEAEDEEVVS